MKVLQDKKQAQKLTHMTSFSTRINGVTYHDLVEALGKPLYNPEDSGDGKTIMNGLFYLKVMYLQFMIGKHMMKYIP
jgi:hypothetical protein